MRNRYHILNGDALREQFPKLIPGERIVCRECLVDGNVEGSALKALFENRAHFLSEHYGGTEQEYFEKVVPEFQKMLDIENAEINLWFEDDLFCQVNFWFVVSLLSSSTNNQLFLVRPQVHTPYGFGGLKDSELVSLYENKSPLTALDKIAELWAAYQSNETEKMEEIASALRDPYPFIESAVKAHIDRIPVNGSLGRPKESLRAIMNDLQTEEFAALFSEFCKRESIYGFGDLQVKRLYDELVDQ